MQELRFPDIKDAMNNPVSNEENGGLIITPPNNNQPQSWPKRILMFLLVGLVVIFWETTKGLYKRTYKSADGEDTNFLNMFVGVLLALIGAINVGYTLGWTNQPPAQLTHWLGSAVATAVAVFLYGWTLLHLFIFKHAIKVSKHLWQHVSVHGQEDEWRETTTGSVNPGWFSDLLILGSRIVIVLTAAALFFKVTFHIQANQGDYGWLGCIVGFLFGVAIPFFWLACLILIGKAFGRAFSTLLFFVCVFLALTNWSTTWSIIAWPFNGLSANKWGDWGYIPGAAVGLVWAVVMAKAAGNLVKRVGVWLFAAIFSAAGTYLLIPSTQSLLGNLPVDSVTGTLLPVLASAAEFFVLIAYVFPLLHILITHSSEYLSKIGKLAEWAYMEESGGYREFPLMVITIIAALATPWFAAKLLLTFVLSSVWQAHALAVVLSIAVYSLGGKWLLKTGVLPLAVAATAIGGYSFYGSLSAAGYGTAACLALTVAGAVLNIFIAFPLLYILVRKLTQGWLAVWLRDPLMSAHTRFCDAIVRLYTEFLQAARLTYNDDTNFRETFLQLANLASTAALSKLVWMLVRHYEFALWLQIVSTFTAVVGCYLLVGHLYKQRGTPLIGLIAAIVCGVYSGILVHSAQPFGLWLSVPGALIGAALTASAFFPWFYLLLRVLLNAAEHSLWLRPILVNTHRALWDRAANLRQDFLKVYRQVRESMTELKESFLRSYEEIRAQMFKSRK